MKANSVIAISSIIVSIADFGSTSMVASSPRTKPSGFFPFAELLRACSLRDLLWVARQEAADHAGGAWDAWGPHVYWPGSPMWMTLAGPMVPRPANAMRMMSKTALGVLWGSEGCVFLARPLALRACNLCSWEPLCSLVGPSWTWMSRRCDMRKIASSSCSGF